MPLETGAAQVMQPLKKYLEIIICIFFLACLVLSIVHCVEKLAHIAHLAKTSTTPHLYTDANFYVNAAQQYQLTGQMYDRPADGETFASTYYPMAPVFKFPPAFQLQILLIAEHWTPKTLALLRYAMIVGYFLACLALTARMGLAMHEQQRSHTKVFLFLVITSIIATANPAFWDCILSVSYEIPIFCLLMASFFLLEKHPRLSAGIIGYLAAVKIYPAFMASFLLVTQARKQTVTAFILSVLLSAFAALLVFGQQENIFYAKNILPVISREKVAPMLFSLSFGSELFRLTQNLDFSRAAFQTLRLLLLATSFLVLAKHHKTHQETNFFALLMVLMLICMPNYWVCYLIMLFPAFCVATRRTIIRPRITETVILLLCMGAVIVESQSWTSINTPIWLTDNSRLDATGTRIMSLANQGHEVMAFLAFSYHYPVTVALFLFEQIKFLVPVMLWFLVIREILSTAKIKIQKNLMGDIQGISRKEKPHVGKFSASHALEQPYHQNPL